MGKSSEGAGRKSRKRSPAGRPAEPATPSRLPPDVAGALAAGACDDPFGWLGQHVDADGRVWVRVLLPGVRAVGVLDASAREPAVLAWLQPTGHDGLLEAVVPGRRERFAYRLRVIGWRPGDEPLDVDDAYRFGTVVGDDDLWLFGEGRHLRPYEFLGAHPRVFEGVRGTAFAVWAPNARRVSVIGDFNGWDGRRHVMRRRGGSGIWEIFVPAVAAGDLYKYELLDRDGRLLPQRADPYAFRAQVRPMTASVVAGLPPPVPAGDAARRRANGFNAPIAIYEVHPGSWRRKVEDGGRFLTWDELADELVPYVADMGFTHVELMPISEHPFDGSWGYQSLGLYAPTARFGDAAGLRRFVDRCHAAGIGVLLDWVPSHFPTDAHGLANFDGTALYEYADPREGFHKDWNTLIYNVGRNEVANFLIGNALYWLERFGIDGLRVDAVASMLYRDYSRKPGEWVPNVHGGRENLESIAFLRRLNHVVGVERAEAVTVAEESTAWPQVTRPPESGGLGFHYKWNMGWMNDTLKYMARDPIHRRYHQDELTFGLVYAWDENFVLPLSHDEVVHGKGSLLGRMPGDRWQQFANLRAYLGFMYAHPGKKLLFMGGEFAQPGEWNHDRSLDWHLLDDPLHRGVQSLVRDLNHCLRDTLALHQRDVSPDGFEWIDFHDRRNSVLAFVRSGRDADGREQRVVAVCNFTPTPLHGYRVGVPMPGTWRERVNTDSAFYGGSNLGNAGVLSTLPEPAHGRPHSLVLTLPPLATLLLQWTP